ncbi:O-antigen ligase family protein [Bradyrhizobium sp. CSA207]|uniref:O-antigen ligase family protein n=1 Tax=Bradyrhizobium sp. CSA207 TaxID=2698826 RepID=UPI0023AEB271|nr:O-antigen ligase family protein [Bradyrhizobium sp. CSA207]
MNRNVTEPAVGAPQMIQFSSRVVQAQTSDLATKIVVWFGLFTVLPVVYFLYWPSVYAFYGAVLLGSGFQYALRGKFPHINLPAVVGVKFALMVALLIFYSDSAANALNIGGVIFVEAFALWFMTDAVAESSRSQFFKTLARLAVLNILIYFVISVALSRFISIQNPIEDFLTGERVRLLAFQTGHSILIDLAFISMAIAVSNIAKLGLLEAISITAIAIVSIFLAKSAGGYLVLLSVAFAFAIEIIEVNNIIRALLYVPFFLAISAFFLQPDLLTDAIFYVRTELQGVSVAQYQNGDLSAGRALLNDMLTKVILENPWTGVGHDDPVIQYGTNIYSGFGLSERKTATTESGLRNAAQYGIPYFCCVVAFILQPLLIAFQSQERDVRIFCQSLSFGLLTLLAVNSQFEVPHEPQHFIYFSLLALAVQFGLKRRSAARKQPKSTNFARSITVE